MTLPVGWPIRPLRSDFSPGPMVDEKRVTDPSREIGADVLNLVYWNTAGVGLCAPKLVVHFAAGVQRFGGFAWDPTVMYYSAISPWLALTTIAPGDYRLDADATVPGPDGTSQPLILSAGHAQAQIEAIPGGPWPEFAVDQNLRAEYTQISSSAIGVKIRNAAGVLTASRFTVAAW